MLLLKGRFEQPFGSTEKTVASSCLFLLNQGAVTQLSVSLLTQESSLRAWRVVGEAAN